MNNQSNFVYVTPPTTYTTETVIVYGKFEGSKLPISTAAFKSLVDYFKEAATKLGA